MFSSDKNIETIAQLVEQLKQYGGLKLEMLKLDATEKTVKIISALILGFVLLLIVCAVAICASFAVAYALADMLDSVALGFLCAAAFYLLLLIIVYVRKKAWIERPLVKFLATILLEDV